MLNWIKNKWQNTVQNLDVKRSSEFNFEEYIISLGFRLISEKNGFKQYVNYQYAPKIDLVINLNMERIVICKKGQVLSGINFIPKGSLFTDMIINQTINNEEKIHVQS